MTVPSFPFMSVSFWLDFHIFFLGVGRWTIVEKVKSDGRQQECPTHDSTHQGSHTCAIVFLRDTTRVPQRSAAAGNQARQAKPDTIQRVMLHGISRINRRISERKDSPQMVGR
jgi:hypothetical protein